MATSILEHWVAGIMPFADGAFEWVANTAVSAFIGLLVGAVVVALVNGVKRLRGGHPSPSH